MNLPQNIYDFGIAGLGTTPPLLPKPNAAGNCQPGFTKKLIGAGKGQPGTWYCMRNTPVPATVKPPVKPPVAVTPAPAPVRSSMVLGGSLATVALVGVGLFFFLRRR